MIWASEVISHYCMSVIFKVKNHCTLITMIKWPGNSPDLNPIENAWSWMKLRESTATNMQEWQRDITELWAVRMNDSQYRTLWSSCLGACRR